MCVEIPTIWKIQLNCQPFWNFGIYTENTHRKLGGEIDPWVKFYQCIMQSFCVQRSHSARRHWRLDHILHFFINIWRAPFTCADPKSAKNESQVVSIFWAFGICAQKSAKCAKKRKKAAHRMMTPVRSTRSYPSFLAVCSVLWTCKMSLSLLVQKLLVGCWRNWPQVATFLFHQVFFTFRWSQTYQPRFLQIFRFLLLR
jgi:hypothetical protein